MKITLTSVLVDDQAKALALARDELLAPAGVRLGALPRTRGGSAPARP